MYENYLNYGPSLRIVYKDHSAPTHTYVKEELEVEINEIDLNQIIEWGEFLRGVSTKIFIPYPALDTPIRRPRFGIASRYILGRLAFRFDGDITSTRFRKFAERVALGGVYEETMVREVLYEVWCHRHIVLRDESSKNSWRMNKLQLVRMNDIKPRPPTYVRASFWKRVKRRYTFEATTRTVKFFSSNDDLGVLSESTYYIPMVSIDPAYDAFVIRGGRLFIFKMNLGLESLRVNINTKGLEDLRNRVGSQVTGKWCFVVVVPNSEKEEAVEVVLSSDSEEWTLKLDVYHYMPPK